MYNWDYTVFGNPIYGLTDTEAGKMASGASDVGRGQFFTMNQTGAETVSCSFHLSGAQLQLFRADWENRNKLNYGAGWFTMELPEMAVVPYDTTASQDGYAKYVVHFAAPFSVTRFGFNYWTVTFDLDIDTAPQRVAS